MPLIFQVNITPATHNPLTGPKVSGHFSSYSLFSLMSLSCKCLIVVWKATTQVGCAVAACDGIFDPKYGKAQFHVCHYNPVVRITSGI